MQNFASILVTLSLLCTLSYALSRSLSTTPIYQPNKTAIDYESDNKMMIHQYNDKIAEASAQAHENEDQRKPTFAVRVGKRGFEFFSAIASKIMEHAIPLIQFPSIAFPIHIGPGSGKVEVTNLTLLLFESPNFEFTVGSAEGIYFSSNSGHMKVKGNWNGQYKMITTINAHGWMEASAADFDAIIVVGMYGKHGHPQMRIINCSVDVGHFSVHLGGGTFPWLINLLRRIISNKIKAQIHEQFCKAAETTLVAKLNDKLNAIPLKTKVKGPIYMEYEYTNDPIFALQEFIYPAFLDVIVNNDSCGSMEPYPTPMPPIEPPKPNNNFMISLWIAPVVFQCLATSFATSPIPEVVIDENFANGKLANFLRTKCNFYEICLGVLLKELRKTYPDSHAALYFHLASPPLIDDSSAGYVNVSTNSLVDIHISPHVKNPKILARLGLSANFSIIPIIDENRIKGRLNGRIELLFSKIYSEIGNIHEMALTWIAKMTKRSLGLLINAYLDKGVPIPLFENISVANGAKLSILDDGVLRLDADLYYVANASEQLL